jgi:hypothetical protein
MGDNEMNYLRLAFKIVDFFLELMTTPQGRQEIDRFLDRVEDKFESERDIIDGCAKIRKLLILPDED